MLWRRDSTPLYYIDFLDYAAESLFLRRVGAGYILPSDVDGVRCVESPIDG